MSINLELADFRLVFAHLDQAEIQRRRPGSSFPPAQVVGYEISVRTYLGGEFRKIDIISPERIIENYTKLFASASSWRGTNWHHTLVFCETDFYLDFGCLDNKYYFMFYLTAEFINSPNIRHIYESYGATWRISESELMRFLSDWKDIVQKLEGGENL